MTSPVIVGQVGVEISASARGFARRLREAVVAEFKGAGLDKALADALGKKKIKIPVEPEFDKKSFPRTLPTGTPSTPRERNTPNTDALMKAFQADVQRQLRALSREALRIPIRPDTDDLRARLAQQIAAVEKQSRITVPTEPGKRGDYERSLQRMLTEAGARVRRAVPPVQVPVKVDTDPLTKAFQADIQRQLSALARTANLRIPVTPDTAGVRAKVAAEIAAAQRGLKVNVPVEPGDRLAYEARLRAMVAAASRTVRASIPVDVDRNRFQQGIASIAARLPAMLGPALQRVGDSANSAAAAVLATAGQAAAGLTSVVNPATAAAVAIGGTVLALFTVGPAASAAAGAIGVLAGALASLPAFIAGGGAVLGTFGLALRGIGAAFKDTGAAAGGGGRSVAASARQIAAAERGISQAQRGLVSAERSYRNALAESLRAQRAIDDARKQAVRRIEDLGRAVKGAAFDERDAALRVKEAERALALAARSRDPLEIERAQLDLEQAQYAAEQATLAAKDAATAKAEADRKGVEGSDEVVAALERQQQASDQMAAAADGLKSAQESLTAANESLAAAHESVGGSAGGAAKEMIKLAPAAQRFVDQIKAMKPAFDRLRLDVQQKAFEGLDKTVRQVGDAWLPQLHKTLGDYATTFNGFFRNLGKNISTPEFIKNLGAGMESVRGLIEKVGESISGPFVDAFGRLSAAAKPFVDAFGDEFSDLINDFSAFIHSADKSGKLEDFFEKTGGYLRDFFRIGRSVGSIFKSLTVILFGADAGKGSGMVETFESLADFLNDPENRRQIAEFIAAIKELGRVLLVDVLPTVAGVVFWFASIPDKVEAAGSAIKGAFNAVRGAVSDFTGGAQARFDALPGQIGGAVTSIGPIVSTGFNSAMTNARQLVSSGMDAVQQRFAAVRGQTQRALASVPGVVSGLMNTTVGRAIATLGTLPGRGAAAVAGLGGRIRSALAGLGGQMYEVGRNVVFGLWNGVTSLGGWLGGRIRSFASSVIGDFQIGFGSHSPSRRMANEVGRWLPPGLAAGMDNAIGSVKAARDRMIAAAIPDVADSYDLRIAPVADPYGGGATAVTAPPSSSAAQIEFVGDAPGSFMRWVKDNVRIDYGGDANQAFGRASTPALAGR